MQNLCVAARPISKLFYVYTFTGSIWALPNPKILQLYFAIHQNHTEHFTQEIIKCLQKTQTLKMLVIFTYSWRETWRTEYWPPSSAQSFLKNHINQLPMCFSIFQLPYEKIFSHALKDTFFAHRIYKCSCNSSAKASSSTWLVESRGK